MKGKELKSRFGLRRRVFRNNWMILRAKELPFYTITMIYILKLLKIKKI